MYYISIDPRGEFAFDTNTFGYGGVLACFVEVLTATAGNAYKDYLRRKRISYIIAGERQVDYELMLSKLYDLGIESLMVGGGGVINWSFLQNGLIDEVSSVIAPVANGDRFRRNQQHDRDSGGSSRRREEPAVVTTSSQFSADAAEGRR